MSVRLPCSECGQEAAERCWSPDGVEILRIHERCITTEMRVGWWLDNATRDLWPGDRERVDGSDSEAWTVAAGDSVYGPFGTTDDLRAGVLGVLTELTARAAEERQRAFDRGEACLAMPDTEAILSELRIGTIKVPGALALPEPS